MRPIDAYARSPRPRQLAIAAAVVAAAALLLTGGCAVSRIKTSSELAKAAEPFQAAPPNPTHRLLIVGDSTGLGTGASSPQGSVAGLIGKDHPDWLITNRARNGAKFVDVAQQLASDERFDAVLVMAGGNDVIRLTNADDLRTQVQAVARRAHAVAPRVILMPSGNVGNAPFFFAPWSWVMSSRSRDLHAIVREVAVNENTAYVNLYRERADDPFAQQPERMNSADHLHPSDVGYAFWYETLKSQASL